MTNEVAEALRAARAKIEHRRRWARRWFAYTAIGLRTEANAPEACKWCAVGALLSVVPHGPVLGTAMEMLSACLPASHQKIAFSVSTFNDHAATTHPMIMRLYDNAIARAESDVVAEALQAHKHNQRMV